MRFDRRTKASLDSQSSPHLENVFRATDPIYITGMSYLEKCTELLTLLLQNRFLVTSINSSEILQNDVLFQSDSRIALCGTQKDLKGKN